MPHITQLKIKTFIAFLSTILFPHTYANKPTELIKRINVEKHRFVIIPHYQEPLWGQFVVEYQEDDELDLRKLDNSQLSIPFILCTAPFIWGSGKTFTIKTMDEDLFYSLQKLQQIFRLFFPANTWSGRIIPEKLKKNCSSPFDTSAYAKASPDRQGDRGVAMLFSGGLDAVCASFGHLEEKQFLITICGNDVKIHEKAMWNNVKKQCKDYAITYGHTNAFIRSNFRTFLNESLLSTYCKTINKAWQEALTALCLTSLAAPLLIAKGFNNLHIGATRTIDFPYPFGTHPLLDNNIAFAGIQVFHDQPEFDRVDKIRFIDTQVKKYNVPYPPIRVCFCKRLQEIEGENCSKCEKCLRTMNEIIVLGINPEFFGFKYSPEGLIARTKALLKGKRLTEGEIWHWQCVQNEIKNNQTRYVHESDAFQNFLSWLAAFDLTKLYKYDLERYKKIDLKKPFSTKLWRLGQRGSCSLEDLKSISAD